METTTDPTAPTVDFDPRPLFATAAATATAVIGAVRPDQLDSATPCPAFSTRELLGHMVGVARRVTALGRGDDAMSVDTEVTGIADDAWSATWLEALAGARDAWSDDASLTRTVVLPWATDTGAAALLGYVNEITVHTWDVAQATGQQPDWDDETAGRALDLMHAWLPGEGRAEIFAAVREKMGADANGDDAFAELVPVAADAPLIDRLVAWNGRRP